MNTELLKRITINQDILHGKPSIRNMRIGVDDILSYLAGGDTEDTLLQSFPFLEREDVRAALEYAALVTKRKSMIA
ncbi:MAG: DUF433 domain-containing protein [Leptospiraceae bacterium]|nr:DUF433 domain-containing protein [Leptospiraceae bacterium]